MDIEELNSVLLSSLFGESKQAGGDGVPCRRAAVDTNYAGKAITTTLDDYQTQFTYTELYPLCWTPEMNGIIHS